MPGKKSLKRITVGSRAARKLRPSQDSSTRTTTPAAIGRVPSSSLFFPRPGIERSYDPDIENLRHSLHRAQTLLTHAEELANLGTWDFDCKSGEVRYSRGLAKTLGIPETSRPVSVAEFAAHAGRE